MDMLNSNTYYTERKRGQHLGLADRGAIQMLHEEGYSNRKIAKLLNCSPSTIGYELNRGTPAFSGRGRRPKYSAKRAHNVYLSNRSSCHRKRKDFRGSRFFPWMASKIKYENWSLDVCHGRAVLDNMFPDEELPSTRTLYTMLWQGRLPISPFDCPEALGRSHLKHKRDSTKLRGTSIDLRPSEVDDRNTFGHWEIDTVIGKKTKGESASMTIVERLTGYYITLKISDRSTESIAHALAQLQDEYGSNFSKVFRSITTDNGTEFSTLSSIDLGETKVYYAHPYSSWERPVNERSNRILRKFLPKGKSMNRYTADEIRYFSDAINCMPRKRLGYRTPEELFEEYLDQIYLLDACC